MNPFAGIEAATEKLKELAATHPEAVDAIGQLIANVVNAPPDRRLEIARRAALVTVAHDASEEALKKILGRG